MESEFVVERRSALRSLPIGAAYVPISRKDGRVPGSPVQISEILIKLHVHDERYPGIPKMTARHLSGGEVVPLSGNTLVWRVCPVPEDEN